MHRLLLLRHAKSSWDDALLDDHERPLAPRGRRAAEQICGWLVQQDISPDLILCSSARRTRETLGELMPAIRSEASIRVEDGLYGAGRDDLLARLRAVREPATSLLLIGHNPGMQEAAALLAADDPAGAEIGRSFPAGALAIFETTNGWADLGAGSVDVAAFVRPRDL
jgi:phosphohistidine phosphatase